MASKYHYFFEVTLKDNRILKMDRVAENQYEAEEWLKNHDDFGFTEIVNNKIEFMAKMQSFKIVDIKDPHDTESPTMWDFYKIEYTTFEDMYERQKKWCEEHWNDGTIRLTTKETWTASHLDSIEEKWGVNQEERERKRAAERKEYAHRFDKIRVDLDHPVGVVIRYYQLLTALYEIEDLDWREFPYHIDNWGYLLTLELVDEQGSYYDELTDSKEVEKLYQRKPEEFYFYYYYLDEERYDQEIQHSDPDSWDAAGDNIAGEDQTGHDDEDVYKWIEQLEKLVKQPKILSQEEKEEQEKMWKENSEDEDEE